MGAQRNTRSRRLKRRTWPAAALALVLLPFGAEARAQQSAANAAGPASDGRATLDRVAAIVNGELILESDMDAERRFTAFQPFSEQQPVTGDRLMERLIDRTLILQQMAMQPAAPVSDAELDAQLATLRKAIPRCAAYHCETDAGWKQFVEAQGFTIDEVRERWRQRMQVLAYIEERFRMGITISQSEIDDYYQKTMLPAYAKEKVTPPAEASIADRVREILLQQQVDKLLDDWLTALRAQGSIVVVKPGEEAP